jgi:hypothetical protein
MLRNFFLLDLCSSLWAFVLFGLFSFVPGYAVGWMADLLDFRRRTPATRMALSVPLSIGVAPLLAYLTARLGSIALTWCAFGVLWLAFVAIGIREPRSFRLPVDRRTAIYAVIAAGWVAVGLFSLIDWSWGNRLYCSVVSYDYSLRSAIVSAISRDGIPPSNPSFFPGHTVPLRYHYCWLIPCSLVARMGGSWVSARHAVIAGALWCGIGLMATIALYLRFVHPDGARRIHRRTLLGVALLAVTGLDIIPNLAIVLAGHPLPEPEWWNEQVSAWITSMLWVPHHIGALIAGLMSVLILWHSAAADTRRGPAMLIAAFCLAGCLGESIYVGLVFGAALAAWTPITLLRGWKRETGFLLGMGVLALALAAPQLWELAAFAPAASTAATSPAGAHMLSLGVRHFYPVAGLAERSGSPNLVFAAFLPFNYFFEFGLFGVAGAWFLRRAWRRRTLDRYELATLTMAAVSLLICTFVRSTVIRNNDLGYRGMLLAQFILLLWAVDLLDRPKALRRPLVIVLLVVGVASSIYEAASLRLYGVLSDAVALPRYSWLNPAPDTGRRLYEARAAYERLKTMLGPNAIVQQNPDTSPGDMPWGLYADRRTVADTLSCATVMGGDPRECMAVIARIAPLFQGSANPDEVDGVCRALGISALVVKDTDPVWSIPGSWVWRREADIAGDHVRVFLFPRK